ncbi:MAG: helix-turn-helix transcriptional regulator [Caulobacterales bacterium]|nr:helix-turn-helix transcriptional regulator [Caulobacterales bacterium]MCA0373468.1 helix-turn-helix transcriptional regulator [Pseudomonadota bacterium]
MLSETLRLLRVFHDLKQVELAERLDVSRSYVSELENGNRTPSLDVIKKYSEFFKIPISSIMFFSENLGGTKTDESIGEKARNAIASKVIQFLQLIEEKTN